MAILPLDYASPGITPAARGGMKVLGWIFFVALAILLFFSMNRRSNPGASIPLSEFRDELSNGNIETLVIEGDVVYGTFRILTGPTARTGLTSTKFRCELPAGLGASWEFVHWMLDNSHGASVRVEPSGSDLKALFIPIIPWIVVGFIFWFIVAKAKRDRASAAQKPEPAIWNGATGRGTPRPVPVGWPKDTGRGTPRPVPVGWPKDTGLGVPRRVAPDSDAEAVAGSIINVPDAEAQP